MIQHKLTEPGPVLGRDGRPAAGYSTEEVLHYDRRAIKAPPWRIKEWDFYQVSDDEKCIQFTIGHASYVGQVCVMLFDFKKGEKILEKSKLILLPFGSMNLPESASKDNVTEYHKSGIDMYFRTVKDERYICCKWDNFSSEIHLVRKNPHAMIINIPFDESPYRFYYNHKINCMTAEGKMNYAGREFVFTPDNSFGLLDWGRGVWPFSNEWFWSSGTGLVDGEIFGFNLGCGFGNTGNATENILFYRGSSHKLGSVVISHKEDYMKDWILIDDEGRLNLTMTPLYDRTTRNKILFIDNCCHQVFGLFNGKAVLDDGRTLNIHNLPAFAEHAVNNW